MAEQHPDISVLVITYNHAPYIRAALESVLKQQTKRSFEIIVSEDASSDGTLAIVKDVLGGDVRAQLIVSPTNLHCNETVARAIRAARGRYLCLLDGDDFWIAEDKLERQAALLDADPTVAACFHNAAVQDGDGRVTAERWTSPDQPARIGMKEVWQGNPFATCAGMLRRDAVCDVGEWYSSINSMITDWPLYVLCARHGDLLFVDEVVAAYRMHENGLFSPLPERQKMAHTARLYGCIDAGLDRRYHDDARAGAAAFFLGRAEQHLRDGERSLARLCAWYGLRSGGAAQAGSWRRWLRLALGALR